MWQLGMQDGAKYTCSAQEMPHRFGSWRLTIVLRRHESKACSHSVIRQAEPRMHKMLAPPILFKANT